MHPLPELYRLEKAFDSIHRKSLWVIRKRYTKSPREDHKTSFRLLGWFSICGSGTSRVVYGLDIKTSFKQGCNMSGFLLLIITDSVMTGALKNGKNVLRLKFTLYLQMT